jgi:hypothetical protein
MKKQIKLLMKLMLLGVILSVIMPMFLMILFYTSHEINNHPRSLTLNFPKNISLGEITIFEDVNCFTCGTGEKFIGEAKGEIKINLPSDRWFIHLDMPRNASSLMPYLKATSLTEIHSLNLSKSDVQDNDLQYIANMKLRKINLSGTSITGQGLHFAKPTNSHKFFWIDVTDTPNLALKNLEFLKGLAPAFGFGVGLADKQRLEEAKKLLCADDPTLCERNIIQLR